MTFWAVLLVVLCTLCLFYLLFWGIVQVVRLARTGVSLAHHLRNDRFSDHRRYLDSENMIPLSLLVPAGEMPGLAPSIRRLLDLDYPEYEVIVVCDSESWENLTELVDELGLISVPRPIRRQLATGEVLAVYRSPIFANLTVLHKAPGGGDDALNAGVNVSRYPHFVILHPLMRPGPDALLRLVMPFVTDPRVVAAAANIRTDFGEKDGSVLNILRAGEVMRGSLAASSGAGDAGILRVGPGAVGAFQKRAVIAAAWGARPTK